MGAGLREEGLEDLHGKIEEGRQLCSGPVLTCSGEQVVWVIASV